MKELSAQIKEGGFKNLKGKVERAMHALRCPPPDSDVTTLSGVCIVLIVLKSLYFCHYSTHTYTTETYTYMCARLSVLVYSTPVPVDVPPTQHQQGEKRRVYLCRTLCANPDLLLLDEPTNHLDAESVEWLEQYLAHYKGTVLVCCL